VLLARTSIRPRAIISWAAAHTSGEMSIAGFVRSEEATSRQRTGGGCAQSSVAMRSLGFLSVRLVGVPRQCWSLSTDFSQPSYGVVGTVVLNSDRAFVLLCDLIGWSSLG
jgi:hypothetical protein